MDTFFWPKVCRLFRGAIVAAALAGALRAAEPPAAETAQKLAREAAEAADAGDKAAYLEKMQAAYALRPDFPRLLVNLAAAQVANDHVDDAIATLGKLAAMGLHSPVDKSKEFKAVADLKEFKEVVGKLTTNLQSKGKGDVVFAVPEMTGIVEGIAWREKTGEFFFGDVHNRCVWVSSADGKTVKKFAEAEELLGVFGLVVDEEHGALWAAQSAVPAMNGYTDALNGVAGLAEIDLGSGAVRHTWRVPNQSHYQHVLGDLTMAPNGAIYLPDSGGPMLWRLAPGADQLDLALESPEFMSLQGAVALDANTLLVSDYANGLLRVDLDGKSVRRLESPPDTTLVGIDGLIRAPSGDLLGIQNGTRPARVLRIAVDAGGNTVNEVTVLESGQLAMPAPSLGCIAKDGNLYFIGNAGWSHFDEAGSGPTPPRPVPIFRTKL